MLNPDRDKTLPDRPHERTVKSHRHPASLPADRLRTECDIRFSRRGGPGGQHRNKVETAVTLHHRPTGIEAEANERRAQGANLRVALRRLRIRLATQVRRPWTEPSDSWSVRCQRRRLAVNPQHDDFPGLLAEAMDALAAHDWQAPEAAQQLGCSTSQLVRLLRHESSAWIVLNRQRADRGLKPLK